MSAEERRSSERYPVRRPIYAFLTGEMEKVGVLKDISMSGLAVEYIVLQGSPETFERRPSGRVIIGGGELGREPLELPYGFVYAENIDRASSPWGAMHYHVERCGIAFAELTEHQYDELKKLVTTFH